MKKVFLTIGIVVGIIFLLVVVWFMLVITGAFSIFMPSPAKPEITYGEFPIVITYEVNGEVKTVEDTIICEFDGVENLGTAGKYRKWKAHLKSGNERLTLLKIDENSELYCWYGSPDYYMGDLRNGTTEEYEKSRDRNFASYFITLGRWENGELKSSAISTDEAWEKYQLKIIARQYAPPITNSFK